MYLYMYMDNLYLYLYMYMNPSPYPLPGPPIRPAWKWRGRTSLSPNTINYQARASKSATLLSPSILFSSFFLLSLRVLWGRGKTTPPAGHRRPA